jgi:hypothetical protein
MLRDYSTGVSEDIRVFSGMEIEHTPAYGKRTLFLARNDLTLDQIKEFAHTNNCEAIYYGANRTYMHSHGMQLAQIQTLLKEGFWITVDYPFEIHRAVKQKFNSVWNDPKFIPFCSLIFPDTEQDTNLCFKVDDVDFKKTNPGVWTMSMTDFKKQAGFTQWDKYKKDEPIGDNQ